FRNDLYHRVLTTSGTFVNQAWPFDSKYPDGAWGFHETLIPKEPNKPIRLFISVGDRGLLNPNVMRVGMHDWVKANHRMAKVGKAKVTNPSTCSAAAPGTVSAMRRRSSCRTPSNGSGVTMGRRRCSSLQCFLLPPRCRLASGSASLEPVALKTVSAPARFGPSSFPYANRETSGHSGCRGVLYPNRVARALLDGVATSSRSRLNRTPVKVESGFDPSLEDCVEIVTKT